MYNKGKNKERLVGYLIDLLKIKSVSFNEKAVSNYVKEVATKYGFSFFEDDTSKSTGCDCGNLLVYKGNMKKHVTLVAHMDTVETGSNIDIVIDEHIIKSGSDYPIGLDDKIGVASMLEIMSDYSNNEIINHIQFLFSVCEEEGCRGSRYFDIEAIKETKIFVLDSGGSPIGLIVNKGFGQTGFEISFKGKPSHAGSLNGVSAVHYMIMFLSKFEPRKITQELTFNVSKIWGGEAVNTSPKAIHIKGEILWNNLTQKNKLIKNMFSYLEEIAEKNYQFELEEQCLPYFVNEDSSIVKICKGAALNCDLVFRVGKTGACSDAHIFIAKNCEAIKIANGMQQVHTGEEHAKLRDIRMLVRFLIHICLDVIKYKEEQ